MTIDAWILTVLSCMTTVLLGVIGFFLKRVIVQIQTNHAELVEFKNQFEIRVHGLEKDVVTSFHNVCHERQSSCGALQEVKLEALRHSNTAACIKIEKLVTERKEAWREQQKINGSIFKRLKGVE